MPHTTTPHEAYTLANGLQVVILPDTRVPVVTHSVWYNVGAMDEVKGKTGLAHMTEHLMFKGTPTNPAGTMDKLVQRRGGIMNAFTSYDFTAYFQKVPNPALAEMMALEADRMNNLKLTEEEFQPERKVVAEERKLTTEADPTDRFFEKVTRQHFSKTGYGHPIIGWAEDIQGYTKEDALNWYKTHYAPNNAALVLVGDVTKAQVEGLIANTYAKLPNETHVPSRTLAIEPARKAPLEFAAIDAQVQVPVWHTMYRAPSSFVGVAGAKVAQGESVALWVLAEILGGSDTARLHQALVLEQELADDASASYDAVRAMETTFDISVQPKDGVALDKFLPAVQKVLNELLKNGVTEAELQKAKTSILADETYARDDSFTAMYRVGMWLTAGGTMATFDDWRTDLANLSVADVNAVAKKYLVENGRTTAMLAGNQMQLGTIKPNL
jgi:zinc protease